MIILRSMLAATTARGFGAVEDPAREGRLWRRGDGALWVHQGPAAAMPRDWGPPHEPRARVWLVAADPVPAPILRRRRGPAGEPLYFDCVVYHPEAMREQLAAYGGGAPTHEIEILMVGRERGYGEIFERDETVLDHAAIELHYTPAPAGDETEEL